MFMTSDEGNRQNYQKLENGIDGRRKFSLGENPRRYIPRVALSPLLFVIAMMPLTHILREFTDECEVTKSQEKINHLMYKDVHQTVCQKGKRIGDPITNCENYNEDIGMEYSIEECTMLIMRSGKRHMTEGVELRNQQKSEHPEKRKLTSV